MNESANSLYAGVVVEAPLAHIFHYRVPELLAGVVRPGDRVGIPFRGRKTRGVVVSLSRAAPGIHPERIREISDISPPEERIPEDILSLTRWAAKYYQSGWGTVLAAAVPSGVKLGRRERATRRLEPALSPEDDFPEPEKEIILSAEQAVAVAEISGPIAAGEFKAFLLHGITGSGKTEVYIRLIAGALAAGRGALMLVPEISLTPQTVSRFRRRFGNIAVLHSSLSEGERAGHWRKLCSGEVRVAVGARSAVFAPVRNLGLVLVDEEHEHTYKQDNDPRYNARDVALMRGFKANAPVILGSATPSLESWANVRSGKYKLVTLAARPGGAAPPRVTLVDIRKEWAEVKRPVLFSRRLEMALGECLQRREQAIFFLNRLGFHTSVRCAACGETIFCEYCDVGMTHHRRAGILRCGSCGSKRGVPENCPVCGAGNLKFDGAGTEKAGEVLAGLFPKARLLRMDSDSMTERDAHRVALAAFARGEYDILLGTQMVAKGLDFPNVTLVGVLLADAALGMSDFRAAERTFQLVTQVIGRAGRAGKAGLAVVQAFQPEHPAVASAVAQDYLAFAETELFSRERRGYPPKGRMARMIISGASDAAVREVSDAAGRAVRRAIAAGCRLLGPAPCEKERLQGVFRRHLLLFSPDSQVLSSWLAAAGVKPGLEKGVRFVLDIDPVSMH